MHRLHTDQARSKMKVAGSHGLSMGSSCAMVEGYRFIKGDSSIMCCAGFIAAEIRPLDYRVTGKKPDAALSA